MATHQHDGHDDRDHDHDHADVPSDVALRAKALQSLLIDKGVIDQETVDRAVDNFEHRVGPHLGAQIVARAWVDPAYRQRLLEDGNAAAEELGIGGFRHGARLVALENTPEVHNVVVCTLCSCYPIQVLGAPPVWYKSAPYRSRVVIEPRSVLAEFGTVVEDTTEVRVWDSNSEVRYLVLPERPAGAADLAEAELAGLVTRNAMIGVERVSMPPAGDGGTVGAASGTTVGAR